MLWDKYLPFTMVLFRQYIQLTYRHLLGNLNFDPTEAYPRRSFIHVMARHLYFSFTTMVPHMLSSIRWRS